ncbi:MAG: hypothetical protein JWR60_4116 [Polaromonas sp.]|nr:hypothetical protein [Polaromonas sp.]
MPDESKTRPEEAQKKSAQPPRVSEQGGHDARDEEDSMDGLANRELDEQTLIARPPLGN